MANFQIIILAVPVLFLVVSALKSKTWLEIQPSMFWFFFMSLPYYFLTNFLNGFFQPIQFFGILVIAIAMFFADYIGLMSSQSTRFTIPENRILELSKSVKLKFGLVVIGTLLIIPLTHVLMSKTLPLRFLFNSDSNGFDRANARQDFTKGSKLPFFLDLLLAWYIPLISVIGIYILFRLRFRKFAVLGISLILIYSFLGLEKSPAVFFSLSVLFAFSVVIQKSLRLQSIIALSLFSAFVALNIVAQAFVSDVVEDSKFTSSSEYLSSELLGIVTPSDIYRFDEVPQTKIPNPILNIVYRTTLTPIDVSFRYYQYYSQEEHLKRNLLEVLTYNELPKSTNIVGNWAFTDRFPGKYSQYIDAYSSIDADIYSLAHAQGIILVATFLVVLRYLFSMLRNRSNFGNYIYGLSIAYFSYLPFQGGIQSMLLSKGLIVLLLISWFLAKIVARKPYLDF